MDASGRHPTDRGKPGTERHPLTEGEGLPVAVVITGANRHDMTKLAALLEAKMVEPTPATPSHPVRDRGGDLSTGPSILWEKARCVLIRLMRVSYSQLSWLG